MSLPYTPLPRAFYNRPTLEVARDLLGKVLVVGDYYGHITETEAYRGEDDPACHAAKGMTPRTKVMFGPAGYSYVYFIYGMYHCLNIVTEEEGFAAAVLIRGIRLFKPVSLHLDGPGKLCRYLDITKEYNNRDMTSESYFFVSDDQSITCKYIATPRIGIKKGVDKPWRFLMVEG